MDIAEHIVRLRRYVKGNKAFIEAWIEYGKTDDYEVMHKVWTANKALYNELPIPDWAEPKPGSNRATWGEYEDALHEYENKRCDWQLVFDTYLGGICLDHKSCKKILRGLKAKRDKATLAAG